MRIGEVARRLGYQDVEYFVRMFRRQTGFLPSRYVWRCDDDCAPVAAPPRSCSLPQSSLLVGVVGCLTGPNGYLFGTSRYMYELAARHINDAGGTRGRRVELAFEDYGCDASAADVCARRLISDRGACVLVGGGTSIGREAIRPVVDELGVPFLYDTMYEGGVADHFTFCVSSVPEQNILPAVDYLAERGARRFFIIVTDYGYGILTAECIKHHLTARGCEVCGIEYFQQEKSRFDVTIENILETQPDALITSFLASNQNRFHEFRLRPRGGLPVALSLPCRRRAGGRRTNRGRRECLRERQDTHRCP